MTNVYSIIAEICSRKLITPRRLAMAAGIPPTTLESAILRQPERVSLRMLESIAQVFGMPWYALVTTSDDETQVARFKNPRWVYSGVREEEAEVIIQHFAELELFLQEVPTAKAKEFAGTSLQSVAPEVAEAEHFRLSIMVVLRKLNCNGLMEVMRHALAVASRPEYVRKEIVPCDCNEQ